MQSGIKYNLLLTIFASLVVVFLISGCPKSSSTSGCSGSCGPHSMAFSSGGNVYLLGYNQLLAINPQGTLLFRVKIANQLGRFMDILDISKDGNVWEGPGNGLNVLSIFDLQGNLLTQITTDINTTSIKISGSTNIGWVGGYNITSNGITTTTVTKLEAINMSGESLTSFTLSSPSIASYNELFTVKLAVSPVDDVVWAWSPGYLSGYSFSGLVYGPYSVSLLESSTMFLTGCSMNEKWITVNPVTNDIWMGTPASTTILSLSPNGTVQFQKNLDINVSAMAVSPKTGNVWIGSNNKIDVLDPYGTIIKQLTSNNINCITFIAISPVDDTVWVGNSTNFNSTDKNIFILDDNGNIINGVYVPVMCFGPCPG